MNILVVDDEAAVAAFCRHVLTEAGHSVLVAHSGKQALAVLEDHELDLVLSDVHMAGMSGLDLLAAIAPSKNRPEVILFTGYGTVRSAVEAMRLGAYDYILKPVSPEELEAAVRRLEETRALQEENRLLRFRLESGEGMGGMIGGDPAMLSVFASILRIAPKGHPVLITGETGTGKELVARAIHARGGSGDAPFLVADCGALSPSLVESELFGYVRGAFTGADGPRAGLLASAAGGTLFLDEIGDLPLETQARLFRVIQEREFRPLGSDKARKFEARVIAATNRNLEAAIKSGAFRPELYYRLNVHHIALPPLRARKGDVPALVRRFIQKHAGGREFAIGVDAMEALVGYEWPGNVRELENCIVHVLAESEGMTAGRGHLPLAIIQTIGQAAGIETPLDAAEKSTIAAAMEACQGHVTEAARTLGISKATLYRKLDRYGIPHGRPRA